MDYNNHPKLKFIYVGIDCHKLTHTACVKNCFNEILDMYTFKNNVNDFKKLLNIVNKHTNDIIKPVFGLEDTKHLGHTLATFLLNNGYAVKHVNSTLTYAERKKFPIISKTDEIDAQCIAKVTLDELDNLPDAQDEEIYWTLKQLISMKNMISCNNVKHKNKLHAQLLHHYPNYKEFFCMIDTTSALDFWEQYPSPNMIKEFTPEELKKNFKTKGRFPIYKAELILKLIKDYDYKNVNYQENRNMLIRTMVNNIKSSNEQILEMEEQIIKVYDKLGLKLHTFIGLSKMTSAEIVCEIGDIKRFKNSSKLAKYAGVAPVNFSSGNHDKTIRNEYGNRELNGYIYYLACRSISTDRNREKPHNAIFLNYYYKKIADGKTKRQALTCVMRRIINIIYNILSKNEEYKHPKELNEICISNYNERLKQQEEKS